MPAPKEEYALRTRVDLNQSDNEKLNWIYKKFNIKKVSKAVRFVINYCYSQEHENEALKEEVSKLKAENEALKTNLSTYFNAKQNLQNILNQ